MNAVIFQRSEASPQPAASESRPAPATRPRQRLVYALLGVFLGFLGLHNYYARHWLTGLLQLLLSIATCLLGFGIIAPWLWALVEAVIVRKDGNGMDMI
jgi:TM2 domain-containing membrane protein YozV